MLISLNWVKKYLNLSVTADKLAAKTTMTSQEVEGIIRPNDGLKNIVVGKTHEVTMMPDSDHLKLCQVDVGTGELTQIVCGAPNVKSNQFVIVALPGARIKDNVKIKRGKMRGYESNGMICSLEEIGFNNSVVPREYADGIYYFPEDVNPEIGASAFEYLGMDDEIIDLDLTPNRGDLQSIMGCVHEFGAFYHQKSTMPEFSMNLTSDKFKQEIKLTVDNEECVPVYKLRRIQGVKIAPSPQWLKNCLWNVGIRPINNVVDVTNYVLYLYGQPMHAFDYDTLTSKQVTVRNARSKEVIETLDGVKRELNNRDIVVTDGTNPIAVAGVMGDFAHEITSNTTNILLESAIFDARHVRETAKRLGIRSESSIRFERGINPDTVEVALNHAASLIQEIAGGKISEEVLVGSCVDFPVYKVKTSAEKIGHKIGIKLSNDELISILSDLGFEYEESSSDILVTFPHRRPDLRIEEDLVEEVARLYGYDQIPMTLPSTQIKPALLTPLQSVVAKTRDIMIGCGFEEIVNYTLVPKNEIENWDEVCDDTIVLPNPMTEDHEVIRRSMLRGMLNVIRYNQARRSKFQHLFEIGHTFTGNLKGEDQFEHTKLAVCLSGKYPDSWQQKGSNVDFYDLSGVLATVMKRIGISKQYSLKSGSSSELFHPGQVGKIMIENEEIGVIGKVNPLLEKQLDLEPTFIFEIDLDMLLSYPRSKISKIEVSKLNPVDRDLSFFVDKKYRNQDIISAINDLKINNLIGIKLFDVYAPNPEVTSFAYSLTFLNPQKTLTDQEISSELAKVMKMLEEKFDAKIR